LRLGAEKFENTPKILLCFAPFPMSKLRGYLKIEMTILEHAKANT